MVSAPVARLLIPVVIAISSFAVGSTMTKTMVQQTMAHACNTKHVYEIEGEHFYCVAFTSQPKGLPPIRRR